MAQDFCPRCSVEAVQHWTLAYARPQLSHRFARFFVLAGFFQFFGKAYAQPRSLAGSEIWVGDLLNKLFNAHVRLILQCD